MWRKKRCLLRRVQICSHCRNGLISVCWHVCQTAPGTSDLRSLANREKSPVKAFHRKRRNRFIHHRAWSSLVMFLEPLTRFLCFLSGWSPSLLSFDLPDLALYRDSRIDSPFYRDERCSPYGPRMPKLQPFRHMSHCNTISACSTDLFASLVTNNRLMVSRRNGLNLTRLRW